MQKSQHKMFILHSTVLLAIYILDGDLCECMHTYVYHGYFIIVNGSWSEWRLGPCSKTCGGGIQNYTRACDNPKPSCGGEECKGLAIYAPKKKCNDFCCPGIKTHDSELQGQEEAGHDHTQ